MPQVPRSNTNANRHHDRRARRGVAVLELVLSRLLGRFSRLKQFWADDVYAGQLLQWAREIGGWNLELIHRPAQRHTFQVPSRRWAVERTLAWLGRYGGLSKDYEALPETKETWIYIDMTGLMLRRLARAPAI